MSKSNQFENDILKLVFNNVDMTLLGDAAGLLGSAADGNIYVSLHNGDPGEVGDQTTNECTYTGYARVAVVRTSAGWTITDAVAEGDDAIVKNTAQITFGECTAGTDNATHVGFGASATGTGKLLYSGALNSSLPINVGPPAVTPYFVADILTVTES